MDETSIPPLNDPWMVAAFEGWNDAAGAASAVLDHLIEQWDAEPFAELDPDDYYDFQLVRPALHRDEADTSIITWPTPTLYHARPPGFERGVVLLNAPEPNVRWRSFCSTIIGLAQLAGVTELVTLGALLTDTPHSRPTPLTASTLDPAFAQKVSLPGSHYSGPIGINAVLTEVAARDGLAAVQLWASVPHYLADPPCPKATLALLGALEDAINCPLPQGTLAELADAWQRGADEAASQDPEIAEYVEVLEQVQEEGELPESSGESIAREFERYLRRRGSDS